MLCTFFYFFVFRCLISSKTCSFVGSCFKGSRKEYGVKFIVHCFAALVVFILKTSKFFDCFVSSNKVYYVTRLYLIFTTYITMWFTKVPCVLGYKTMRVFWRAGTDALKTSA